jgi:hypothetical protein
MYGERAIESILYSRLSEICYPKILVVSLQSWVNEALSHTNSATMLRGCPSFRARWLAMGR